jgi:RNA polymerase sigma-70 factor, ECF subfamily
MRCSQTVSTEPSTGKRNGRWASAGGRMRRCAATIQRPSFGVPCASTRFWTLRANVAVSEHTTLHLLKRIRAGDGQARTDLVQRIEPLLERFARGRVPSLLRHEQDTADLLQSTWLRVLDKLEGIRVDAPGDFFSYLRTVLLNGLREALRRHHRSPIDAKAVDLDTGSMAAENVAAEDWVAYEQALARLPQEQRVLLQMRFEFGMSFVEIAEEFDEKPDAIRMRVNRAVQSIAEVGDG